MRKSQRLHDKNPEMIGVLNLLNYVCSYGLNVFPEVFQKFCSAGAGASRVGGPFLFLIGNIIFGKTIMKFQKLNKQADASVISALFIYIAGFF